MHLHEHECGGTRRRLPRHVQVAGGAVGRRRHARSPTPGSRSRRSRKRRRTPKGFCTPGVQRVRGPHDADPQRRRRARPAGDGTRRRGATVHIVELYRRLPTTDRGRDRCAARRARQRRESCHRGHQRGNLRGPAARLSGLDDSRDPRRPLFVPGARVAARPASSGWPGPVVQATSAEDAAMMAALTGMRATADRRRPRDTIRAAAGPHAPMSAEIESLTTREHHAPYRRRRQPHGDRRRGASRCCSRGARTGDSVGSTTGSTACAADRGAARTAAGSSGARSERWRARGANVRPDQRATRVCARCRRRLAGLGSAVQELSARTEAPQRAWVRAEALYLLELGARRMRARA